MGLLIDYFAAPDDAAAAATLEDGPVDPPLDSTGIEPSVALAALEIALTGVTFEELLRGPEHQVAGEEEGGPVVLRLRPQLLAAVADAAPDQLAAAVQQWATAQEMESYDSEGDLEDCDVEALQCFAEDLADLARTARAQGQGVYCRLSL